LLAGAPDMSLAIPRRGLLAGLAAIPAWAQAQPRTWPNRPVRIVIPSAPGGPLEVPGRFIAEQLTTRLGQPFIVEARPGAGIAIGTRQVVASTDQHTLLLVATAIAIQPAVQPDAGFDPGKDLLPVSLVSEASMGFMVRPDSPIRDLAGLVAAAKAAPGRVTYGSSGNGTTTHMAAALFGVKAGMPWQHVPYRGQGQLISGFLAGDVDVMSGDLGTLLPHHREGRGRVIAVTAPQRVALLPDVPSVTELVPDTGITIWFALFAPRNFPEEAMARLQPEIAALRGNAALTERMAAGVAQLLMTGPAELEQRVNRELPIWRQVVAEAGIRPE
jgi:tripartite-type tricarboxylate transporter receptor subunit TctC